MSIFAAPTLRNACWSVLACLTAGVFTCDLSAQGSETLPSAIANRVKDDVRGVTEFFETTLPGTLRKYNMTLDFSPKFGDIRHREFIRYRMELRYGLSDNWELFGGLTPFSPNPINSGHDHRWGLGEARIGMRYDTERGFGFYDRATLGVELRAPLGDPPVDLIDGYTHLRPFLTASRELHWPFTTLFTTFSYDRAMRTPSRDDPPARVIRQHIGQIAPGILYKPGEYGVFAEYDFRHLDEDEGYRLSHGGRIGPIWDIPLSKTRRWKLPGKWQIELAYKVVKEEGRKIDHGVAARVRVRTTLREVLESDLTKRLRRDR
jgi:hypothetical protein